MKSAEVLLVLAFVVISLSDALNAGNKPTNGEENSVTEANSDDALATKDPLEGATTKNVAEDDSTVTNEPSEDPSNETVTTDQSVTSATSIISSQIVTDLRVKQASTPSGGKRRLSTEVDKSKCNSLGIEIPNATGCKCYKQKSAGTDTPRGFCFYYECDGNPPTLSKHKCEWVKQ